MVRRTFLIAALIVGLVPMALAQLNSTDKTFVMSVAKANTYEIKAGHLAEQDSHNGAYKPFARMIVNDHTRLGNELKSTIGNVDPSTQLPSGVSATQQSHLDALNNAGNQFDTTFRDQMISTHVAAIKLFENYIAQPNDNPQVKQWAKKALPVLRKHLRHAKKLPKQ